jgi:hypothetical protein
VSPDKEGKRSLAALREGEMTENTTKEGKTKETEQDDFENVSDVGDEEMVDESASDTSSDIEITKIIKSKKNITRQNNKEEETIFGDFSSDEEGNLVKRYKGRQGTNEKQKTAMENSKNIKNNKKKTATKEKRTDNANDDETRKKQFEKKAENARSKAEQQLTHRTTTLQARRMMRKD